MAGAYAVTCGSGSSDLARFAGAQIRLLWPADYGPRRIALHDPAPVYPDSLICRSDNPYPARTALRDCLASAYLASAPPGYRDAGTWTPK